MPTPMALMPRLEGLVGSGLRSQFADQSVSLWLKCLREIMLSNGLRDATDWDIAVTSDAVNAGASLDATGGTVYGVLVDSIFDVAGEDLIVIVTNTSGTFTAETGVDFGADEFGPDNGMVVIRLPDAASATTPAFGLWLDPSGQVMADGVFAHADGQEGTAPTALDVRVYVVYRDSTETRVSGTQN